MFAKYFRQRIFLPLMHTNSVQKLKIVNEVLYLVSIFAIFYYVSTEKLLEHYILQLKQLKRWLGANIFFATRVWATRNYATTY